MKKTKTNLLIKLVILAAILYIILLAIQKIEGFVSAPRTPTIRTPSTSNNVVHIYFGINATTKAPIFISSSNPGVTFVSSTSGGLVTLNISSSLGTLKDYFGFGWSNTFWNPIVSSKLDRGTSAGILYLKSGDKILHTPSYTGNIQAGSIKEVKLPQAVSTINIYSLNASTLNVLENAPNPQIPDTRIRDAQGNKAKILIELTF
jgi:hypothetical protein